MIDKNMKAVAKKRYPWLGICDVRAIDFDSNRVDLLSKQNGVSTSIDITDNEVVFLPFTGFLDVNGEMIRPGDLLETPISRALNIPPTEVIFKLGKYQLAGIRISLLEIADSAIRKGSIYDNCPDELKK